jgi:hypothetical protein
VLTPLLLTLVLLNQAPAAPDGPITVLIAPPDTAGVPGHVVEFAQEHVAEQARGKGLTVIRMKDFMRKLPSAKRRQLLKCKRTELRCLTALGEAAKSEVVLVAELLQRMDGYRVGTKIYKTENGGLVAENLLSGVREDGMLDALTQSLDAVVPQVIRQLRPHLEPPVPPPGPGEDPGPGTGNPGPGPGTGNPGPGPGTGNPGPGPGTGNPGPGPGTGNPDPPPPPRPPQPEPKLNLRRWAWAPAAVGVASAGAGTYFFLQARSKYNQLDSGGSTDNPLENPGQIASDGRNAQNLSRITFGIGAAALATAGVFYLFPGDEKPVQPTVTVGPGGGMVGLVGTWP